MSITVSTHVTKRCPYVDEIDVGTVALTFADHAPELHALAKDLAAYRPVRITHEDFTAHLLEVTGATGVVTTWHTAGFDVTVRA